MKNNKIVLGISGGVDSTTAALLLLEKGFDVYGMYFNIHEGNEGERKEAYGALREAYDSYEKKQAAETSPNSDKHQSSKTYFSDDKFIYKDASHEFKDIVMSDFCCEYKLGKTPNPCVICNPNIKFRLLKETADALDAPYIATGHYARTVYDDKSDTYYISAIESKKDQSYMLYRLPSEIIKRLILPLAEFADKEDVRNIARENGFSSAEKSDSQEICFIENGKDYVDFIKDFDSSCKIKEGNFIDKDGNILGHHKGLVNYTIGQRKGLGIALGHPVFITNIDNENNTVTLGDNEELFKSSVYVEDLFFTETGSAALPEQIQTKNLTAKVRYAAPRAAAEIAAFDAEQGILTVRFQTPQRAMTPGQSLVIYDGDIILGGGRIQKSL
ncbi:MAG: tRNA 2-thiouridine(34) synthase MnmA [Firmicutes bacterium]|nr:tRNA 2-thiouridine(34) synthase MnmA [Bacillota bacterium]